MRRIAAICLVSLLSTRAGADVGPKPRLTASGFEVLGQDLKDLQVAMSAEEVNLTLEGSGESQESLGVEATFHMLNEGPEVTFEEGFPVGPVDNMKGFSIQIDGQAVKAELVDRKGGKGGEEGGDFWYVWKATYKAGAESVRVVRYAIDIFHFSEYRHTGYVLHTGAAWKGPIGKAVVTLRCKGTVTFDNVTDLAPKRDVAFAGDACVWTMVNLEPTPADDVSISYNDRETWAQRVASLRKGTATAWSPRQELVFALEDAAGRQARERMTEAELNDYLAALADTISELQEKEGRHVLPSTEPEQVDFGSIPPEEAEQLRKMMGAQKSPRPYMQSDDGAVLTRLFDRALAAATAHADSAKAREVLQAHANLCQWFLDGTLYADEKKLEVHPSVRERFKTELKASLERAAALLKK